MLSRRQFVGACAVAGIGRRVTYRRPGSAVALAHLTVGRADDVEAVRRGAGIGRGEVLQTGQLLRTPMTLELLDATDIAGARTAIARWARSNVMAVTVGGDADIVTAVAAEWRDDGPLLMAATSLTTPTCRSAIFAAAPTADDREVALRAWRASTAASQAGPAPVAVSAWSEDLVMYGADSLNQRFRAAWDHQPGEPEWLQWFAIKAVAEAALRSKAATARQLAAALRVTGFDGHKGQSLHFDARQHLVQPLYVVGAADDTGTTRVLYTWHGQELSPSAGACP